MSTHTHERLGPYRVMRKIGEGGMGVVHLGVDDAGREVAIKVLHPHVAADLKARDRLFREVDAMRRVRSPYVAEVLDAELAGDRPYVVTRFAPGRTLEETVQAHGPLGRREVLGLARGLCRALVDIHAAGVVHRDLKPSNVMIVGETPLVIDFGIAHLVDAVRLTRTGMFVGTPGYLAPEIIKGEQITQAADVHALASTVFFAATGTPPFGTGPFESICYNTMEGRPRLDLAPAWLRGWLSRALDVNPSSRPHARELLRMLDSLDPAPGPERTRVLDPAASPDEDLPTRRVRPGAPRSSGLPAPGAAHPGPGAPHGPDGATPGGPIPGGPVAGGPVPGGTGAPDGNAPTKRIGAGAPASSGAAFPGAVFTGAASSGAGAPSAPAGSTPAGVGGSAGGQASRRSAAPYGETVHAMLPAVQYVETEPEQESPHRWPRLRPALRRPDPGPREPFDLRRFLRSSDFTGVLALVTLMALTVEMPVRMGLVAAGLALALRVGAYLGEDVRPDLIRTGLAALGHTVLALAFGMVAAIVLHWAGPLPAAYVDSLAAGAFTLGLFVLPGAGPVRWTASRLLARVLPGQSAIIVSWALMGPIALIALIVALLPGV
jgi:hypothetical protein